MFCCDKKNSITKLKCHNYDYHWSQILNKNQHNQHVHCTAWSKHCRIVVRYDSMTFQNSDDQANMATFLWAALMAHHISSWRERQHLGAFFMGEAQHGKMNDSVAKVFVQQTLSCSCFCDVYHINTRAPPPLASFYCRTRVLPAFAITNQVGFSCTTWTLAH